MGILSRIRPLLLMLFLLATALVAQQPTIATTVPLILPAGLAYDAAGNLYFAESGRQVVRRVSPTGVLTTVAGTGVQGYDGDGGPATAALLDSPAAVAVDGSANLYIADAHNHCIRRVDAGSGVITTVNAQLDLPSALAVDARGNLFVADQRTHRIMRIALATGATTTVAGNGTQGFSGDGGPAIAASIDSPMGIAVDAAGDLFLADSHNQRVRRVDAGTGAIATVATGSLSLPRGLVVDASGDLFVVDSRNHRVVRVDAATGQVTTIAGQGTQTFAGDGGLAVAASLDTPRAITLSPADLPTLSDSGNGRVRQVDANAVIHTIAGLGTTVPGTLVLSGPAVTLYGTGTLTATLQSSAATGSVNFFATSAGTTQSLATTPLAANVATLGTSSMTAGAYTFDATYGGDAIHAAAKSGDFGVTISPAPLLAKPDSATVLYGVPIPSLTGSLSGLLAQDSSRVSLVLASGAALGSAPGAYPINATIAGGAAVNYALTQSAAAVTIAQAPAVVQLTNALAVQVASTTSGTPSGVVTLYDAGVAVASAKLSASGACSFATASLSSGTHTLTAGYAGDVDFLAATSSLVAVTVGAATTADFSLAATGQTSVSVTSGAAGQFSFAATPVNGVLSSPILLAASGLPVGATASFNPAYLPPANTPQTFVLTIQTTKTASIGHTETLIFAALLPVCLLLRKRRLRFVALAAMLVATAGCGDRISTASISKASAAYNITVTGTATSSSGATLQHSAVVTLTVE